MSPPTHPPAYHTNGTHSAGLANQRALVKIVGVWTACGFIGDLLALYLICRPTTEYWAVPAANGKSPIAVFPLFAFI